MEIKHVIAEVGGDGIRLRLDWHPEGAAWNRGRETALMGFDRLVGEYLAEHLGKPTGVQTRLKRAIGEVRGLKLNIDKLKLAKEELVLKSETDAAGLGEALVANSQEIVATQATLDKAVIGLEGLVGEVSAAKARLEDVVGSAVDFAARTRTEKLKAELPTLDKGFSSGELEKFCVLKNAILFLESPERFQHIAHEHKTHALRESGLADAEKVLAEHKKETAPRQDPFHDRQSTQPFPTKQMTSDEFDSLFKTRVPQVEESFEERMRMRPTNLSASLGIGRDPKANLDDLDVSHGWGAGPPGAALLGK